MLSHPAIDEIKRGMAIIDAATVDLVAEAETDEDPHHQRHLLAAASDFNKVVMQLTTLTYVHQSRVAGEE